MGISTKGIDAKTKVSLSKAGANYKPRENSVQGNAATWETVQKLAATPIMIKDLQAQLKEKHNHANFVNYAIRRGWLATK